MGTVEWLGIALQLLGTGIAGWALRSEMTRERKLEVGSDIESWIQRDRESPWDSTLEAEPVEPTLGEAREYQRQLQQFPDDPPVPPHAERAIEFIFDWVLERERKAGDDWKDQAEFDERMRADLVAVVRGQSALIRDDQRETRKRVLWELGGLFLVAVGTTVGAFGS